MSEVINNREYRQQKLKEIIRDLHGGASVADVKGRFHELIKDVGATEIAELEQQLISEGMPEEEIKRLCDVHVEIFRDTLDSGAEESAIKEDSIPGHPVHTFKLENENLTKVIEALRMVVARIRKAEGGELQELWNEWRHGHSRLAEVEKHYSRKENVLFPYLERYGITGPPSVMWSIQDDIRRQIKGITAFLGDGQPVPKGDLESFIDEKVIPCFKALDDMIYKESNILFPMALETLSEDDWKGILDQSDEIGYTLITPEVKWHPARSEQAVTAPAKAPDGLLQFDTGKLSLDEISLIFDHLPVDITFVDKEGTVRYFSQAKERIFQRSKAVIGRKVGLCHPPESVHVVMQIVQEMRMGKRDTADFWINMNGSLIYIRYIAVRDADGSYAGVLEVTQNVSPIKALEGEKRLLSEV